MTAGRKIRNTFSKDWCTPKKYVDAVREFFGKQIDLDPCSGKYSVVHAKVEYTLSMEFRQSNFAFMKSTGFLKELEEIYPVLSDRKAEIMVFRSQQLYEGA
ncbi:MAG: hypothetical protein ABSF24_09140 [Candidatus Bathyarchaeia archaeon]|jgi:hypothetical protein